MSRRWNLVKNQNRKVRAPQAEEAEEDESDDAAANEALEPMEIVEGARSVERELEATEPPMEPADTFLIAVRKTKNIKW